MKKLNDKKLIKKLKKQNKIMKDALRVLGSNSSPYGQPLMTSDDFMTLSHKTCADYLANDALYAFETLMEVELIK